MNEVNETNEDLEFIKEIINNNELKNMARSRPIYEWIISSGVIDLYKCCKLCILARHRDVNKFFYNYNIHVYFTFIKVLNEYALEFFKGHTIPFNREFWIDRAYYTQLFGNIDIHNFDYYAYNNVLTKEKAEFIINLHSEAYTRLESDEPERLEFAYKCKLLGIDEYKLRTEFSISYDEYNLLSEEYYNYRTLTYEDYKKLSAVNTACISYVTTLVEISNDLGQSDITVDVNSAKKLLEFAR